MISPSEEDALRTLGDLAGINIDNLPPLTPKQNEMMDDLILDLNYDSHLSLKTSCHDLPFEDPYFLNSTKDHDSYANKLPPSWAQYERMDKGGFFKMPLDCINCHTHQSNPMVNNKNLIFGNEDYSYPFDTGISTDVWLKTLNLALIGRQPNIFA